MARAEITELHPDRLDINPGDRVLVSRPGGRTPPLTGVVKWHDGAAMIFEREGPDSFPERLPITRVFRKLNQKTMRAVK